MFSRSDRIFVDTIVVEVCFVFKFGIEIGFSVPTITSSSSAPSSSTGGIMKFELLSEEESETGTPCAYSKVGSFKSKSWFLSSARV